MQGSMISTKCCKTVGICTAEHRWEFDISNGVLKWKCIFLSRKHLNISVSSSRPATRHKNGFRSLLQKMLYSVHLGRGIIIATIDHAGECAADTEHSGDTPHAHCHNHNIIYHIKSGYKKAEHGTVLSRVLSSVHYIRYPYSKYWDPFYLHCYALMYCKMVLLNRDE